MKTLFICGKMLTPKHRDEDYDDVVVVDDMIEQKELEKNGIMIRDVILKLWNEDKDCIKITVDAHPAFATIVADLKYLLKQLHEVNIDYIPPFEEKL